MIDSLKETPSDWIDFKYHKPNESGFYHVTCCTDPDNVIKWDMASFCEHDGLFYTLSSLTKHGSALKVVRFWRKSKQKCT